MIANIKIGSSFSGCVNYVMGKRGAQLIGAKDVLYADSDTIIESFEAQAKLNSDLGKMVGHISLSFSAEDKDKITNAFLVKMSVRYMEDMGIVDTPFIIVRHNDTEHPHCHIVFSRVNNNGKTISDKNDRIRSTKICRELTEKYGLYIAPGKDNVKRQQLRGPDKIKYEIYDAIKAALPHSRSWDQLTELLGRAGISVSYKYKGSTDEKQGVIFTKDGQSFNGSKIDRQFSYSKLDKALGDNLWEAITKGPAENYAVNETPFGGGYNYSPEHQAEQQSQQYVWPTNDSRWEDYSDNGLLWSLLNSGSSNSDDNEIDAELRRQRKKKKGRGI